MIARDAQWRLGTEYRAPELEKFRVGDFIRTKVQEQKFGWVTGLAIASTDEVILRVRWARAPDEEAMIHPANVLHLKD